MGRRVSQRERENRAARKLRLRARALEAQVEKFSSGQRGGRVTSYSVGLYVAAEALAAYLRDVMRMRTRALVKRGVL